MEKRAKVLAVRRPYSVGAAVLLSCTVLWSCSSSKKPASSSTGASAGAVAALPEAPPVLPLPPPIRELPPTAPHAVQVISDGTEGSKPPSLIEASRLAKAKIRDEGIARPIVEITDENLKEFSDGGQVVVLEASKNGEAIESATTREATSPMSPSAGSSAASATADRELFWRQSVPELRTALRRSIEDLRRVKLESTLLRQQFYSESDSFVRDNEVKPRWDRTLDQLSTLRRKAKEDHDALKALLTEAAKAGVDTTWLEGGTEVGLTAEEVQLLDE